MPPDRLRNLREHESDRDNTEQDQARDYAEISGTDGIMLGSHVGFQVFRAGRNQDDQKGKSCQDQGSSAYRKR